MFRPIRHTVTKESVAVGWAMCHSLQFRQKGPPSGLLCNWMGALCKHVLMRSRRMCSLRNSSVDLGFCITTFLPFSHEYINLLFWSHSSLGMLFLGFISNFWINITFKKEKKQTKTDQLRYGCFFSSAGGILWARYFCIGIMSACGG